MTGALFSAGEAASILFGCFFVLLVLRVPVAFALGLACLPLFYLEPRLGTMMLAQETFNAYNSFILLALADMGLTNIWAKASNANHARILERIGATHVVFPEERMGERVAHLLNERLLDFIAFGDEFAIARLKAPEPIVGLPLVTSACRKKYNVTVVGVKRAGEAFIHAVPDTIIFPADELVGMHPAFDF